MEERTIQFKELVKLSPGLSAKPGTYGEGHFGTFPKREADQYIRLGWAMDPDTGEQGERKPGAQALEVHNTVQQVGAE